MSNGATPVRPTPADVAQHAHPRPRSAAPTATVAPAPSSAPRPVPHAPSGPPAAAAAAHPRSASQPPTPAPEQVTGAQALVKSLERLGVDTVFGIPGGAILPAYDPLMDSTTVRHILVRHEQGAGHAAEGYAAATGRVGVCMATSGPGATNLVTPLADAYMDSMPIVAITGQVSSKAIGTDAFQEADIRGITMPITKHNYLVTDASEIPRALAEAFHVASTGRPGPVLVDISKDALQSTTTFSWPPQIDLPGYRPVIRPHSKQIREAARLITAANRPVLYIGGGVIRSGASDELRQLVELTQIPVVTTLMARGAVPDSHALNLGMPGMHGTVAAVTALQKSDLLITIGARFDDRVTGQLSTFAPGAKIIHADIDPAEISKNRVADVPIVGDAKEVIRDLVTLLTDEGLGDSATTASGASDHPAWKATFPLGYTDTRTASSRSTSSSGSGSSPARRASTSPASASTRCGRPSTSSTSGRTPGSTPAASGRWATRCRPPWAPRSASRTASSGRSTATAASR